MLASGHPDAAYIATACASYGVDFMFANPIAGFFVLGAVPMGWIADRAKRTPVVGVTAIFFGGFVLASGFAVNAFMLFWTRFATGITKASTITVCGSRVTGRSARLERADEDERLRVLAS